MRSRVRFSRTYRAILQDEEGVAPKYEPSPSAAIFDTRATGSEDHPLIHAEGMTAEWWARTPPC